MEQGNGSKASRVERRSAIDQPVGGTAEVQISSLDKELEALNKVIAVLRPLEHEDRRRIFASTLVMLGIVDADYVLSAWQSSDSDSGDDGA